MYSCNIILNIILNKAICDNTPPADPHYLNPLNYSWPLESSSGFSHLWPGVFHIPLQTQKDSREGGRKEEQTIMNLG